MNALVKAENEKSMEFDFVTFDAFRNSLDWLMEEEPDAFVIRNSSDKVLRDSFREVSNIEQVKKAHIEEIDVCFKEIIGDIRIVLFNLPDEIDYRAYAYGLYCYYLYKQKRNIVLSSEEFAIACDEAMVKEANVIELSINHEVSCSEIYIEFMRYFRILMKRINVANLIEFSVDPHKDLKSQAHLIDELILKSEERYSFETEVLNNFIHNVLNVNMDFMVPGEFHFHFSEKKLRIFIYSGIYELDAKEVLAIYNVEVASIGVEFNEDRHFITYASEHYWKLRGSIVEHQLDGTVFYESDITNGYQAFSVTIGHSNRKIKFDEKTLYRESGEIIYDVDAVLHEMVEENKEITDGLEIADEKAKIHFLSVLNERERAQFNATNTVTIYIEDYSFILHEETSYNNIIRIPDDENEKIRLLCITPTAPQISKYDVKATVALLLKSGQMELLNEIAFDFELDEMSRKVMEKVVEYNVEIGVI